MIKKNTQKDGSTTTWYVQAPNDNIYLHEYNVLKKNNRLFENSCLFFLRIYQKSVSNCIFH